MQIGYLPLWGIYNIMTENTINIGILGCGAITQYVHFEACRKARNVRLYAICDAAQDLLEKMNQVWGPVKTYPDYDDMLEDPKIDAVIIAVSDRFHVPFAMKAVQAGKHVLVEKPLSHCIDECLELHEAANSAGKYVQVGHMKRFDPGIEYAHDFIQKKMGQMVAFKAWYGDHLQRYTTTDNLQPLVFQSKNSINSGISDKEDLARYYLLAHGSHLLDTANFLAGKIGSIKARLNKNIGIYSWFCDVEFANGALGHLDLTIKIRLDWHEGFQIYGEYGSVIGKTYNPWFYKSSDVECYLEADQAFSRPLGADGFSYRKQLEYFADVILGTVNPSKATDILQGLETVKGMIAIHRSVQTGKTVYLDDLNSGSL